MKTISTPPVSDRASFENRNKKEVLSVVPKNIPPEITESDETHFNRVVSEELNERQINQILNPSPIYPRQESVMAVHWHPEFVPMELNRRRIEKMFPGKKNELIIPTQHNEILSYGKYSGVEVDCYSQEFNQKVQLLLHFETHCLENAHRLRQMLAHTFKYRSSQLFDFIRTITQPDEERLGLAAKETGAGESLIYFVRVYVKKIEQMLDAKMNDISPQAIKNKLLRNFFDCLRPEYGDVLIDRVQTFLTAVKMIVKANFSLQYFFKTSEVIEEARALRAGIVIPHPEQFWPILLANYDVDGVEVWNPQSRRYTEFLISVINEKNQRRGASASPLLIFMGDDTHMGEKTRDPREQSPEKTGREIGVQPGWDDLSICKTLVRTNVSRESVIEQYKARLTG
jgi:hypothetical protein